MIIILQWHILHVMYVGFFNFPDIHDKTYKEDKEDEKRNDGPNGYIMNLFEIIFKHGFLFLYCFLCFDIRP